MRNEGEQDLISPLLKFTESNVEAAREEQEKSLFSDIYERRSQGRKKKIGAREEQQL